MTKQTMWLCAQRRLRSAWASAQSDQSLRCPYEESLGPKLSIKRTAKTLIRLDTEESLGPKLSIKRTAKTLIRLGGCPGWSESSLGAQSFCCFLSRGGSYQLHTAKFKCKYKDWDPWLYCLPFRIFFIKKKNNNNYYSANRPWRRRRLYYSYLGVLRRLHR